MAARHPSKARRVRSRTTVGVAVALVVVVIAAGAAFALNDPAGHSYRTAIVSRSTVAETLSKSGTIEPVTQATVAFPMAGAVASVQVHAGQRVTTGQALASLDTTTLRRDLAGKQSALAAAQLTLHKALNGEAASGSGTAPKVSGASTASSASTVSSGSTRLIASTQPTMGMAQQQVLLAQQKVDAAMTTARASLQAATTACAPASGGPPSSRTTTSSSTPSATMPSSTPDSTTPGTQPSNSSGTACLAAQQAALRDEQTVAAAQRSLAQAQTALNQLLASAPGASGSGNSNGGGASGGSAAGSQSPQSPQSSQPLPTAEQLVAYQAAVDAAAANVAVAVQALAQATIVSPISGTVAVATLTVGRSVTAASTTGNVVVVGEGGYEVATSVTVSELSKVSVGDKVTVVPDGNGERLAGKVVAIGVAATTSSTSTTYPVVVGFNTTPTGLRNGAPASLSIEVAHSKAGALTVPTSAVQTTNGLHFVTLLAGGKTTTARVSIGAVGPASTEVTSGVRAGQVVVLADRRAALPSSNTGTRIPGTFGAGFGGGIGGAGGFGGGTRLGG